MCLYLFRCCTVVDIAHEDAPSVNVLSILTMQGLGLLVELALHLTKFSSF